MTTVVAAGRRILPRGWTDFAGQLAIWFGFYFAYLGARSLADRNPAQAFWNGWRVITFEQRTTHDVVETTTQSIATSSHWLLTAAAWTYWNSEFTVVGLALLWVYLRHNDRFIRFRNTVLLANIIGLVGYITWPTAPPWMYPSLFTSGVNHSNGLLAALANPYAAMPSLHSADALIVAFFLVSACKHWWAKVLWALWPVWVWFCVLATANHFLLDVLAGIAVGIVSLWTVRKAARAYPIIASLL
ncbi:MAG: inositol phosphorylceramide synthase [Actinobacteria bacterium]|nr:inositol phosphorylceramide synthase [Actinomycetota bacterium]MBV8480195.1 inositol phosphorylceramide synthase [Actinomycetota bacterium]